MLYNRQNPKKKPPYLLGGSRRLLVILLTMMSAIFVCSLDAPRGKDNKIMCSIAVYDYLVKTTEYYEVIL